jgi:hypothetical protein
MGEGVRLFFESSEDLRLVIDVVYAVIGVHQHFSQHATALESEHFLKLQEILNNGMITLRLMFLFSMRCDLVSLAHALKYRLLTNIYVCSLELASIYKPS